MLVDLNNRNEKRGRAGIDHIVMLDELEQLDINSLLGKIKDVDSRSIKWHLTSLMEQNLVERSDALDLLMDLISFSLALDDPNDPFKPVFVGRDGTRTLVPLDLKKEQIDVLAKFARTVDNPELRARLTDVCWFIQKNLDMAEIAIDAYCDSVEKIRKSVTVDLDGSSFSELFDPSLGIDEIDFMTRATQIYSATKWTPVKASKKFKQLLTNLLEDADKIGDGYGFYTMGRIFLEHEEKILPFKQLVDTAEKLTRKPIVHPDLKNDLLRLADEARQKIKDKTEEGYDNERKEEPSYSNNSKDIKAELNALIASSPTSRMAPAFGFGDDSLLHIISPPDLQEVVHDKKLLEELKSATDDLKQMLNGTNKYPSLLEAVVQYEQPLLKEQISISSLYARGVRFENAIDATRKNIESGESSSFSGDMEGSINSVIDLHGTYIMSNEKGRSLVEDADAYRQSPQETETLKAAGKQLNRSIAANSNLFGQDVKEYINDVVQDIGEGSHPERSNQVAVNTLLNLISGFLKGVKNNPVIATLATTAFVASTPGINVIATGTNTIDAAWFFLSAHAPLLKVIAASAVSELSWIISLSNLVDRLNYFQKSMTQDLSPRNFEKGK